MQVIVLLLCAVHAAVVGHLPCQLVQDVSYILHKGSAEPAVVDELASPVMTSGTAPVSRATYTGDGGVSTLRHTPSL
ncbi:hypothetical protein R1flu_018215 [Riccia fluitans]|uniref:Uncharacterized protein n=1 Tax=Riccia fluitans TaxID=41844 RepID=A0ABD1ZF70_9MARC